MVNKVLIVDDNEKDIKVIKECLIDLNFQKEILIALSGEEGIKKALEYDPDVIILDTELPGIDGFETCRRIKQSGGKAKILIFTGFIDKINASKASEVGADLYAMKSMDYHTFLKNAKYLFD